MLFPAIKMLKEAVKDYIVAMERAVKVIKNDKERYRMKCIGDCPWEIFCSWAEAYGSYQIKIFNPNHICNSKLKNPIAYRKWVAMKVVDRLKSNLERIAVNGYNFMA